MSDGFRRRASLCGLMFAPRPTGITPLCGVFPVLMKKSCFHLLGLPRWRSVIHLGANVCSPSHRDYAALRRVPCIDEKKLLSSSGITSPALGDPFGSKCLFPSHRDYAAGRRVPCGGSPKKTKAFCGAKVLFSFPFRMQASLRGGK